jgi:hypothetical protein
MVTVTAIAVDQRGEKRQAIMIINTIELAGR